MLRRASAALLALSLALAGSLHAQRSTPQRIAIDQAQVTIDGVRVGYSHALQVEALIQPLKAQEPFAGEVFLDVAAGVAYHVVRTVLAAIAQSGHTRVRLGENIVTLDWKGAAPRTLAMLWIKPSGYVLGEPELIAIDTKLGRYDAARLRKRLQALKKLEPAPGRFVIAADDDVRFEHIREVMATAIAAGFPTVDLIEGGIPAVLIPSSDRRGTLKPTAIRDGVAAGKPSIRACYESHLARGLTERGRIAVKFVIGRQGNVILAAMGVSDIRDEQLIGCVVGATKRFRFPRPEGGVIVVTYPFVFE